MSWKLLNGAKIDDIATFIRTEGREKPVHIGTDSLQTGKYTRFVTVVAILNPPKGGRIAYTTHTEARITSLRERLNKEVWESINLAIQLGDMDVTVHIDANPNEKYLSSKYLHELAGLVIGQGFKALWKPESWAATHAADHVVRLPKA
jgi:predicted RNase H-related nuclease YkuK (DUF458 family)